MATPIQRLAKLSLQIFKSKAQSNETLNKESLYPIAHALNDITKEDINFNPKEVEERDAFLKKQDRMAPVTCMSLCHHQHFTMIVFIVKAGKALPLHDHPHMFGLLKVICGSVQITSYSKTDPVPIPDNYGSADPSLSNSSRSSLTCHNSSAVDANHDPSTLHPNTPLTTVVKNKTFTLTENDGCCILTPTDGNFHEIISVSENAAFLDILAPPYDDVHDCKYYKEVSYRSNSGFYKEIRWLMEIPNPKTYWCDALRYSGPSLFT